MIANLLSHQQTFDAAIRYRFNVLWTVDFDNATWRASQVSVSRYDGEITVLFEKQTKRGTDYKNHPGLWLSVHTLSGREVVLWDAVMESLKELAADPADNGLSMAEPTSDAVTEKVDAYVAKWDRFDDDFRPLPADVEEILAANAAQVDAAGDGELLVQTEIAGVVTGEAPATRASGAICPIDTPHGPHSIRVFGAFPDQCPGREGSLTEGVRWHDVISTGALRAGDRLLEVDGVAMAVKGEEPGLLIEDERVARNGEHHITVWGRNQMFDIVLSPGTRVTYVCGR